MEFLVVNEVPGRLRVRLAGPVPAADVDALATATRACKGVLGCTVYPRIGSLAVRYAGGAAVRERVLDRLRAIDANRIFMVDTESVSRRGHNQEDNSDHPRWH